jgi:hypothetical protein
MKNNKNLDEIKEFKLRNLIKNELEKLKENYKSVKYFKEGDIIISFKTNHSSDIDKTYVKRVVNSIKKIYQ